MDLPVRLDRFESQLKEIGTGSASWQIAEIFNALLEEVRKQHPDDPIVAVIRPAEKSSRSGTSTASIGTLRTATSQLRGAVSGF